MDHLDNKHCVETEWSCWYHYKLNDSGDTVACGAKDNPTMIQLRSKSSNSSYPTIDFEVPRQRHDLAKVDSLMEQSFIRGRQNRGQEIGKLIKDLIAL